ncbi:MAG TPA: hypothetical protein VL332_05095 [Candidatus Saccharimonadaceae bacterium]|jgi:hypothetical protein|nr:hypothetical protein [Candidatus Saccharimonadaceae bacterium]
MKRLLAAVALAACAVSLATAVRPDKAHAQVVPQPLRGRSDAERSGVHDANNMRTIFWNFGMVGDYPADPGNVDLSVFHSMEEPKGSGMNYSDGVTPFVLTKITQTSGLDAYIMETGFRERQGISSAFNRVMRFEPRPGYFQADPNINKGRSPAISSDPRTWPTYWPDRQTDPDDPGWSNSWDGYFGKRAAADQESYTVMDDDYYDAWDYIPDSRDSTRHGLGLRVEVRGFQWSNPQAGNVIFWHYDITNESTTDYDNIIFGLYMDSGVGGSALSCDGVFESDDDNAFWDKSVPGLNLVYTWDVYGHGVDLNGNCDRTGYLGYAYLETPGNPFDGIDNDQDGIIDESRESGPGLEIIGQPAILAYMATHYDTTKFVRFYGPIQNRPAYKSGIWWTGDEDLDWVAEQSDVGADGVPNTHDTGEGDGIPTSGEPNFDKTDLDESDQIGLTGFKMSRIRAGLGNPDPTTDNVLFYTDSNNWPQRLYDKFTDPFAPARFDSAVAANYNIAFLFASGPFSLKAGKHERFSLALAYGGDLQELRETVNTVQLIYKANYQFAIPPPTPTVTAEAGDHRVQLAWDDVAERALDPLSNQFDFEGYRIYRSTDPNFLDPKTISNGRGTGPFGNGVPIKQFDLIDGKSGFSHKTVNGVAYYLGDETGITHTWTDTTCVNGQQYYYAVCAYDYGFDQGADSLSVYPSENAITVHRTPRGGTILPINVVAVRPNPRVPGWTPASVDTASHVAGTGTGSVALQVVNSTDIQGGHLYRVDFTTPSADSVRATHYSLRDSTAHTSLFSSGADFDAQGIGPVGDGILPLVFTPLSVSVSPASGWDPGQVTNTLLSSTYQPVLPINQKRPGFPDDITVTFDDVVRDTSLLIFPLAAKPAKFRVVAHSDTGDTLRMKFRFRDTDNDGTLSRPDEFIDIVTYANNQPNTPAVTWRVQLDTLGQGVRGAIRPPRLGDVYQLKTIRPFGPRDVFTFGSQGASVNPAEATAQTKVGPYVVPNPYIASASFEPARFAESGRGERRLEFRNIPINATVRIYTVKGDLVRTLRQDGSSAGIVPWDLRTKDNLDVAPGLYIFHVDAPGQDAHIGKLAVIK